VIVSVRGLPVRAHADLAACVAGRLAGERVALRVLHGGRPTDLTLTLPGSLGWDAAWGDPDLADFFPPAAFDGDLPLRGGGACGGPVVGLDGKAVGVAVARIAPQSCVIVPADRVAARLADVKAGKPLAALPPAPAPAPAGATPAGKKVTATIDDVKAALKARGERFRSLFVEYEVTHEAHVEPQLLVAWQLGYARDYAARHRDAFSGTKVLWAETRPALAVRLAPADRVGPDAGAPAAVAARHRGASRLAKESRERGSLDHLFTGLNVKDFRLLFDGKTCWGVYDTRAMQFDASTVSEMEMTYLSNLGLRRVNPIGGERGHQPQDSRWFPGSFSRYEKARVCPAEEAVDGAGCVVIEGECAEDVEGKRQQVTETLWLDPAVDYAPRRWEARTADRLLWRRTNADFREFAPGCWLPLRGAHTIGTPGWAAAHLRDRPALSYNLRLLWARVNDVPDEVFKPDYLFEP
jgi:hypothetical protein